MSEYLKNYFNLVENVIKGLKLSAKPEGLYEVVEYCLKNGGKRIRPIMTLMGCELFGGNVKDALSAAVGLELFHNFTLMHDDIMDNAPIRRGQASAYKKYGTNAAILSGDALLALAYDRIIDVPENQLKEIIKVFNNTVKEVCEGQQYDMNFESLNRVSEAEYLNMIRLKTAVLPANCLFIGGLISQKAKEQDLENLYSFGESIGLAFQIQDDWLDVYSDEKLFGKKTGGDILANKKTWLYIKALELADYDMQQVLINAFSGKITSAEEKIKAVKSVYNKLEVSRIAQEKINSYFENALTFLDKIDVSQESKISLREFAGNLMNRAL